MKKFTFILTIFFAIAILTSTSSHANVNATITKCSRVGSIALSTADSYAVYLELMKRKHIEVDFETWTIEKVGASSIQFIKDDLNLLYEGKIRSPALFGTHIFSKCMDTSKANIKWIGAKTVPMCFKNLEIANSIANAKQAKMTKEEIIIHLRSIGDSKFIDNVMGLGKVNEIIDATYKTSTVAEEIDFQETMIQQCLEAGKSH